MIKWGNGIIKEIVKQTEQLQVVKVLHRHTESLAINYLDFHPKLNVGEKVIINQTANQLSLGTGGYDFIVKPEEGNDDSVKQEALQSSNKELGHIMKLRYTPYQFAVQSCEEQGSSFHSVFNEPKYLAGMPVVIGELHSMLPIIVTIYRCLEQKRQVKRKKIAYIMTDGGALPIAFSNHVKQLKELGWLDQTITFGQSFGGDIEAINIYTALIAAKYICEADFAIVLMGPGIVGTGTWLGHSGIEQGIIANAVKSLKGTPIPILRASLVDSRARHNGISHHTITNLSIVSLVETIIPYPELLQVEHPMLYQQLNIELADRHKLQQVALDYAEIKKWLNNYPFAITTMGKGIEQDPLFLQFVASSAYLIDDILNKAF